MVSEVFLCFQWIQWIFTGAYMYFARKLCLGYAKKHW